MSRAKHPHKEIEQALLYAEAHGWKIVTGGSHAWGKMYCPENNKYCRCGEFCILCVWCTPKNPHNHARALCRIVDRCAYPGKGRCTEH